MNTYWNLQDGYGIHMVQKPAFPRGIQLKLQRNMHSIDKPQLRKFLQKEQTLYFRNFEIIVLLFQIRSCQLSPT